jgi:hypothetical protein
VAAATVYGVLVLAGTLPGAAVLLVVWARHHRPLQPRPGSVEVATVGETESGSSRELAPSAPHAEGVACG